MYVQIHKTRPSFTDVFNSFLPLLPAQSPELRLYNKISIPGDGGYDYVAIDHVNNHLFVSQGTSFNVIDLATDKPVGIIEGMKGVHGIAIVNEVNKGFISDGRGNAVVVIDLSTFKIIKTIALAATDEYAIIYDPYSKKVFVFNGDSKSACVIDLNTLELVKTIDLDGGPEFAVSDVMGLIYNNIEDQNSLKVINTKTMTVKTNYPLAPCEGPTGLALDAAHVRLFTGCRGNKGLSVVEAVSGKVITTRPPLHNEWTWPASSSIRWLLPSDFGD